jgi:hypothetical protein
VTSGSAKRAKSNFIHAVGQEVVVHPDSSSTAHATRRTLFGLSNRDLETFTQNRKQFDYKFFNYLDKIKSTDGENTNKLFFCLMINISFDLINVLLDVLVVQAMYYFAASS